MTTDSKDFRIKNGLIVQGATATVNGNDILVDTEEDINHILGFIDVIDGGELSDGS